MKKRNLINTGYTESRFFDGSDFKMEVSIGRSYLDSDIPATLMLYNVDYRQTRSHKLYGESKNKVVSEGIELKVRYVINESEKDVNRGGVFNQHNGDLIFTVYEDELKEKNADIRRGDFVTIKTTKGVFVSYEVYDDDRLNVSNNRTLAGLDSFFRRISCKSVSDDVFKNSSK